MARRSGPRHLATRPGPRSSENVDRLVSPITRLPTFDVNQIPDTAIPVDVTGKVKATSFLTVSRMLQSA